MYSSLEFDLFDCSNYFIKDEKENRTNNMTINISNERAFLSVITENKFKSIPSCNDQVIYLGFLVSHLIGWFS